eukprot:14592021-Alexandrium_andersonii.AAC.1
MCIRDRGSAPRTPPRSASGAPAGPYRQQIRHLREQRHRMQPSGASGTNFQVFPGPAPFQVRTPEAILAFWD